jgi:GT2 family glycosyltransferase
MSQNPLLRPASFVLFPVSALLVLFAVNSPVHPWVFLIGATGIFISMLLLARLCTDRHSFIAAIVLAMLVRIVFLAYYPACVDVNRYIWEGVIQHQGLNPFTTTPNMQGPTGLPDFIWQQVIFRDSTAMYWPFAQLLFRLTTAVAPSQFAMKLVMTLFDIAAIGLLFVMVRRKKHPLRYVLLYAMNPLVLISISGQGHLEAVVVALVLAALCAGEGSQRFRSLAYVALSCAILTKIYAVILLPVFLRNIGTRRTAFLLLPLLLFIPYLTDISYYFKTLAVFAGDYAHNGLLHSLLTAGLGLGHQTALMILAGILGSAAICIFFLTPSLLRAASSLTGLMLLSLPTVHPWYFLLISPYLVFFRQGSWLGLQLSALLLVFYFNPSISPDFFHNRLVLMTLEYLPFLLLAFSAMSKGKERWPAAYSPPAKISVVIPVRNEEERIVACLDSVLTQHYPCEIIVVDGGSTDRTPERISQYPEVSLTTSAPGRGTQIAAGVAASSGDTILVLHADSRLLAGAIGRMAEALTKHPEAAGGAMAAIYDSPSSRFKTIALLNNLRARFSGISFGDQAQFFRHAALPQGFPDYRLMEDIELSMRMKENGSLLFLAEGVRSSCRRWNSTGYFVNFITVIRLTGTFLFLRAFGLIHDKGEWFYRQYYRKER